MRTFYLGYFENTSDSTRIFHVCWIGRAHDHACFRAGQIKRGCLLLDDRLLHYLLDDDDVTLDWTLVKDIW